MIPHFSLTKLVSETRSFACAFRSDKGRLGRLHEALEVAQVGALPECLSRSSCSVSGLYYKPPEKSAKLQIRPTCYLSILDKTIMEIEGGWPALIRNTRNIGEFNRWRQPEAYQKALDRLLRDLKAESARAQKTYPRDVPE